MSETARDTSTRLTMEDVAGRLRMPLSTLYEHIRRLEAAFPNVQWYRKIGRRRLFTEQQFERLEYQLCEASASTRQEPERETEPTTPGSPPVVVALKPTSSRRTAGWLSDARRNWRNDTVVSLAQSPRGRARSGT